MLGTGVQLFQQLIKSVLTVFLNQTFSKKRSGESKSIKTFISSTLSRFDSQYVSFEPRNHVGCRTLRGEKLPAGQWASCFFARQKFGFHFEIYGKVFNGVNISSNFDINIISM